MQTRLVDLVLNLLRKDQYAAADENPDELYLVTDDAGITGADVVNALGYVPYNGTTNPDHYITSSSIPTVGNGTIRIKQDNKTQQFTVNQTATQLISLNGLYDYYTINATVHSSPTISGANVSDFSNGWLSYQYQFPNNWEISTTFFLDNPPSETADEEEQMIIYSPNLAVRLDGIDDDEGAMSVYINGNWYNLGIYPYSGEDYQVTISSYNQADGVHTVGTYVYVFSTSADEELYNAKLTSNVVAPTNTPVEIQFGAYNGTEPLQATMYFDETYINVLDNGTTRYWTGAEKTIDTKANKDDIKNGTLTITQDGSTLGTFTANQSTNTNIDVKGLYDYYVINANKQGSIVIDGATASGFSASSLVWKSYNFPTTNVCHAINTEFSVNSLGSDQIIFSDSYNNPNLAVKINGSDNCLSVAVSGTWYSLANTEISEGETYQIKLTDWIYTDGQTAIGTYLYVYSPSLDEVIYNGLVTSNAVTLGNKVFYFGTGNSGSYPLNGSIDLSQTFFEINNIAQGGTFDSGWQTVWTGATPTIDTKANTDLNNLIATASPNFDGQWVTKDQVIASNVSFATGGAETKTYSLASYLPNDGATYEVLFSLGGQTAATSGSSFAFILSTDIVSNIFMCRSIARTAAYVFSYGNAIVPLTTKQVKVTQATNTSGTPTMTTLRMCAYRRVGTNT